MRNKPAASLGRLMAAAMIALSLVVLASGAAEATPAASCDENFRQMLEDRSDAGRVQDNAATYGLIPPNDAAAGMTCMDQAMGVTGRLGNIFSDRHDDAVPAANTVVFTPPLAYPDWGAGEFLIGQLSETLTPMLEVHMGRNFGGSIGSLMGFNVISPQFTGLIDTVMNFTGDIGDKMAGFNGDIGRIMSAIDTIQQLARALELPMPSALIMGAVAALEAAQGVADQLMGALQSAMNAAIQPLIGQVMDQVMGPTAEIDCDNIAMLWNGNGQEGVVPLQGGGARPGVPFMSVASMISGAALNGNSDYMSQLQSGQNMDILNRAMNNLTQGGLSRPGILPSWRPAPSFGRNASTDEIIEQMRMQN